MARNDGDTSKNAAIGWGIHWWTHTMFCSVIYQYCHFPGLFDAISVQEHSWSLLLLLQFRLSEIFFQCPVSSYLASCPPPSVDKDNLCYADFARKSWTRIHARKSLRLMVGLLFAYWFCLHVKLRGDRYKLPKWLRSGINAKRRLCERFRARRSCSSFHMHNHNVYEMMQHYSWAERVPESNFLG